MTRGSAKVVAAATALALVAVACGNDDGDEAGEPAETTAGADEEAGGEATGEPIKIGALTSLNGPFTPWGLQVRDGMELAVDEINAEGGVDGRPLELTVVDDQSNPDEGVTGIERLIDDDVVAIGGTISSDVGLATARIAEELETPLFLVKAGSEQILTRDSRFTFRTCLPAAPMVAAPIAQFAEEDGLTKVGAVIADYAWGQAIRGALEEEFDALEDVDLQVEVAPVEETDFATYLRSIDEFDPDLLVATGHPPGSGPITVQSQDLGIDTQVTGAYAPLAAVVEGAGDAAIGRYADFDCADFESDEYQDLARRFLAESDQTFMDDDAVAGFGIVQMVAQAVEEVGDDPAAIAEFLHEETFDLPGYAFEMSWTEWGELAAAQPIFTVLGEGPAPEGVNEAGDWYPETLILPDPLEPFEP